MIRFLPGIAGAVAAYVALIFTLWLESAWIHAVVFFGVYVVVTFAIDKAMKQYGKM